ncbi:MULTISPECIES: class I SAM-dependent methyltransferase [unclassified Pseudomonas]|uniref:class I SAM-dependent methyltransferase n=1 Tax=unclassified Pseudomonas TaxID=196821 RepID=UPI000D3557DE|nr:MULTISPECIES: class I SAM-dependent methyltransferase [unclassified Pseudomonas]RAU44137.1 class I SAM-dependent methyltransferase [Pseudomonas sp. RIT 409]RAU55126.1 class I SAM-dependent methyltransferase [Pseudomonas sp. RIT 412]
MREFENPDHWDVAAKHYQQTAHPFTAQFAEAALARISLTPESKVLDVATGTGALALAAARTGAQVLATDFSPAMVACVKNAGLPNVEARVMDGQSLGLPDASFDATFSIFGVIMFPDWRKGLAEMHRVTAIGGYGIVATWQEMGAATFLLLGNVRRKLFPDREGMVMPEAVKALGNTLDFARELIAAGFRDPVIERVTHDYQLDVKSLDNPDTLFGMSPDWTSLTDMEKATVIAYVREMAGDNPVLPIPSTALIAVAQR